VKISDEALEEAILRLAHERGEEDGICPSEVARDIASKAGLDWKSLLLEVRATAVRLAKKRDIAILRNGEPVDPDRFRGLYRIAPANGLDLTPKPAAQPAPPVAPPLDPLIVPAIAVTEPPPPRFAEEPEFVREIVDSIAQAALSAPVPDDIEPRVVLTMDDLLNGDLESGDLEDLPPLVFDDEDQPYETQNGGYEAAAAPPEEDEDDDPDLYRAPDAATLEDVATGLQRYLAPELDDAPRWNAEIGDDVVGLPGQEDEQPVLPSWHDAFGRYLEGSPADEERG
jgi:hypothetical protein